MNEERLQILEMLREGKITSDEALRLLDALEKEADPKWEPAHSPSRNANRMLRIRINGASGEKVNVNVPLGLIKSLSKISKFIPKEAAVQLERQGIDLAELDIEGILRALESGLSDGKLVDIEDASGTKVDIYVE